MDFRLLRLILIDSYSPGRVVEFPLEGGAVLTGRNGRGKTTLLQLVPIFYGENPARIVGTETNRLDFNGYYLPRLTSYIVFEYQRRDQVCLAVLHASEQGGERRYRFVRSPYRPDLFLLPDGCNVLQSPVLRRHFKLKGVLHSEAIASVGEYRAIVQGKVGSGKSGQRQRQLVAEYACAGSGHHLTHIEKIVSGMFLRRTDFQDLQRMVVSCISDTDARTEPIPGPDCSARRPPRRPARCASKPTQRWYRGRSRVRVCRPGRLTAQLGEFFGQTQAGKARSDAGPYRDRALTSKRPSRPSSRNAPRDADTASSR